MSKDSLELTVKILIITLKHFPFLSTVETFLTNLITRKREIEIRKARIWYEETHTFFGCFVNSGHDQKYLIDSHISVSRSLI